MKEALLTKVAEHVNTSRSTVSKALNHSFGIDDSLRERIFTAADMYGLKPKRTSEYDIYVIMPEIPTYFWVELYKRLFSAFEKAELTVKFNIYSKIGNCSVVERYLDEAEASDARLIIIAAHYEGMDERLSRLSETKKVFVICEDSGSEDVFVVGSNQESDGSLLAAHCLEENPRVKNILLIGRGGARFHGFYKTAENKAAMRHMMPTREEILNLPGLSRMLSKTYGEFPFELVVCLSGFTSRVCMAMKKCGICVPCYGFELPFIEKRYMLPGGTVVQDIASIADRTVQMADEYLKCSLLPPEKNIFIPSEFLPFPGKQIK